MNSSESPPAKGLSEAERDLFRKSVRDFLQRRWPADAAVERSSDAQAVMALWQDMAGLGLPALGSEDAEAGLREILLAFEELGRAACPAPLLGAVAANRVLVGLKSNAATALLDDLHRGKAAIALALGAFDGDPAAGQVDIRGNALSGKVSFVEGVEFATYLLVLTGAPAGAAIVPNGAPGTTATATPGLAVPPFNALTFAATPATFVEIPSATLAEVALLARLACAGRALGAAQRAFELAVEHAKVRKQFGQLIGQFQAVQHKLANNLIALDGARLALESAADARDRGDPAWSVFAAAALAFAGPALREVIVRTHQALGAIGYAEEHEAPRHFRSVHADLVRFGGVNRARAELADYLLGAAA
jgi:acyl-CoA dehydrogenase